MAASAHQLHPVSGDDSGKLVNGHRPAHYGAVPLVLAVFVPFIIITSFAVLNLFIGIIVDAMQVMHDEEEKHQPLPATKEDIAQLRAQLQAIDDRLKVRDELPEKRPTD